MKRYLLFACLMLVWTSCKPTVPADRILYRHAEIWTGDAQNPTADALVVEAGRIAAIGKEAALRAKFDGFKEEIDLGGNFVVPGFTDSHTHFMSGGFQLASVDLRDASTPEEFIRRLAAFAKTQPKGRWILGGDWDHERWGGTLPDRSWIDSVTTQNPVLISRLDGHMALANSTALTLGKISKETPEIPGGTIVRRINGEPTGVLKDEAMTPVYAAVPPDSPEAEDEALQRAQEFALSLGVTQVHDMGQWAHLRAYRRAQTQNALKMRIYSFVPLASWDTLRTYVAKNGRGDDWLRWGGVKGFVDGSLGSTTAWFFTPYLDEPNTHGLITTDTTRLERMIIAADKAGLQVAVHAIGDRANDWLLKTFEKANQENGARDRRFRIEHAQHLSPSLVTRLKAQAVIGSMQPYHAIDDGRWAAKRIGRRIDDMYMFRTLLDQNAHLAFGSDWTVAPIDPLKGIYAAVTRRTLDDKNPSGWVPQQKITVEETLRAYTAGCAYAGFQEQKGGLLATGRFADFVVLSENLLKIDPIQIPNVQVLRTIVGGKEAYRKKT